MQEVHGMAAGSGQPLNLVLVANFRQEIQTALGHSVPDACTDIMVDTMDGTTGFAHNEDYDTLFFDKIYMVRQTWRATSVAPGVSYVSYSYPGVLPGWAPGWNSHGIAMSWNVLYPANMRANGGAAAAFVCRDVLGRARTVEEAIELATPDDMALGQNLNVGVVFTPAGKHGPASQPRILTAETAPSGAVNMEKVQGTVFHANEYLRMINLPQIEASLVSSKHRRKAFEATQPRPKTLKDALHVLGDTSDGAYPIFRRNDTTREDTLFTVLFDLVAGTVTTYRDNPRLGEKAVVLHEELWGVNASSKQGGVQTIFM
eukprot:TRINITY_DN20618_c0_g1_i2.p1 TRINITY_DN20618_c0_g1~~TRINITY_DN20618_c0_g1_i2.p1  ORF type:complete len:316 (-),score=41.80 TRINITY_DN20618_c0_g1_i2:184-1131(-)